MKLEAVERDDNYGQIYMVRSNGFDYRKFKAMLLEDDLDKIKIPRMLIECVGMCFGKPGSAIFWIQVNYYDNDNEQVEICIEESGFVAMQEDNRALGVIFDEEMLRT